MILDLIYFINIVLSILIGIYLWLKMKPTNHNLHIRFLSAYFILNAICFGFYLLIRYELILYVPYLYKVPIPLNYLIAPFAYFHLRIIIKGSVKLKQFDLIHLLPFLVFLISYTPFYFQNIDQKSLYLIKVIENFERSFIDNVGIIPEYFNSLGRIIHPFFYLSLQWILIFSSEGTLLKTKNKTLYNWVYNFTKLQSVYTVTLFFILISSAMSFTFVANEIFYWISVIIMAGFFFSLGIYLFWNQNILTKLKYFKINSTSEVINQLDRITEIVYREKYFKSEKSDITNLANQLDISKNLLSELINKHYSSYNTWINELRVKYSIDLIAQGYLDKFSVEALSKECGFSSKNTFYRAFKRTTGATPILYIESLPPSSCFSD